MLYGMGTVVVFLGLLVLATFGMSGLITRYFPEPELPPVTASAQPGKAAPRARSRCCGGDHRRDSTSTAIPITEHRGRTRLAQEADRHGAEQPPSGYYRCGAARCAPVTCWPPACGLTICSDRRQTGRGGLLVAGNLGWGDF